MSRFSTTWCTILTMATTTLWGQNAIINEFSADPGMWDGTGGEFIELYCPGGVDCDISCWVISDGQGLITIPSNTTIPAGGYYLIAHEPAFNCSDCDFYDLPVDLNTETCNCLSGGSFGTAIDGRDAMILGRGGNAGELMLLYDELYNLVDSWKFDNASQTYMPLGGDMMNAAANGCNAGTVHIPHPDNTFIGNVGAALLGCNTSYTRSTDGNATWVTDNHPTPRSPNSQRGDAAFDYYYRVDGGSWQVLTKNGTSNIKTSTLDLCDGNTLQFRVLVRNYQQVGTTLYDPSGKINSYFESPQTGRIAWASSQGLGSADGENFYLFSDVVSIPTGTTTYTLQWSDYKNGLGSTSASSTNECYERMVVTSTRNELVVSAVVECTDADAGLNRITTSPAGIAGLTYSLYDDIGDQSNLVATNTSGFFSLTTSDVPAVGYYVVVTGPCNLSGSAIVATDLASGLCRGTPPCPEITGSSFLQNGDICGLQTKNIKTESFEGALGVGYTVTGMFNNGTNSYFDLINDGVNPTGLSPAYNGANGAKFWAGEDIDAALNPNPAKTSLVTINNINITNYFNINVSGLFAAPSGAAYDVSELFRISTSIDGAPFTPIGAFESTGTNTLLSQDSNLDGTGDGVNFLSATFQNFTFPVSGTGSTLAVQIEILASAVGEEMAFDNIRVTADTIGACVVCPSDVLTFSLSGIELPGGGMIDWYSSTAATFDPYAGAGTFIGSTAIPSNATCSSIGLSLNEVMNRPSLSNGSDPDAGEYVELIGTPGTDIGCTVITDGDWTITIPPGTMMPAEGLFTIGNNSVYGSGTFDLDAEGCACFTDAGGGSGLLILTDVGEYVALFNGSGTFLEGMVFGTPAANNTPPQGANAPGGVITTAGLSGCPASVTIPGVASFETAPGSVAIDEALVRNPDGSGAWTTQAGGTVDECNFVSDPAIPDFAHTIDFDDCNQTLYFKGIINPHPNTVSCPNTDPSASTQTFQVTVSCPTATLTTANTTVCSNAVPVTLSVSTTGITNGTNVTIHYTLDGAAHTVAGIVNANLVTFTASQTGTYTLQSLDLPTGCDATGNGSTVLTVVGVPAAPVVPATVEACQGDLALIGASGATQFEWSYDAAFGTIAGTGVDFSAVMPSTVHVRGINYNDAQTFSCIGSSSAINVVDANCPIFTYPIELLSFTGYALGDDVVLHWHTASELNNDYFEIERSNNVIHFETLGQVKGAGTTLVPQSYQWLDTAPDVGWNYYRLRQVDTDGSAHLTKVIAVLFDSNLEQLIHVYPNPVQHSVHIQWQKPALTDTHVIIYNNLGQRVQDFSIPKGAMEYDVDAQDWAAGIYHLYMYNRVQQTAVKIVKE